MSSYKGFVTVGIDVGCMDSVIAYVGRQKVDVVQNEMSSRKTATLVAFRDRNRLLGDAAGTVIKSNLKNTVRNFRHLVGRADLLEDQIKEEKFYGLAKTCDTEDGSLGFSVNYQGEQITYTATQITAMYLTKMKQTAEKWCEARVQDMVVSVPAHFDDFQRSAVLDAGDIAGLNCLRLMNETSAIALDYGIYRVAEFDKDSPTITAFGHMGHSSFSFFICTFTPTKLTILAEKTVTGCAGRDMDAALIRHFAGEFEKKHRENPLENKKTILKMEEAVQKCKKNLSANDQSPIGIECLMEDLDLSSKITRDTFEELCAPLKEKVKATVAEVIGEALKNGLESLDKVSTIEITGGASRVPWFQQMMSESLGGKDLSRTLNADETVARGCALQAAILSPSYRVREFKVEDAVPHPITLTWMGSSRDQTESAGAGDDANPAAADTTTTVAPSAETDGAAPTLKRMDVFKKEDHMELRRFITWYRNGEFELTAKHTKTNLTVGEYKISLPSSAEKKKVKIEARLNGHGLFSLDAANLVESETYEEIVKEKREITEDPSKTEEGAGGGAGDNADVPMPDAAGEDTKTADGEKKDKEASPEGAETAAAGEKKKPKYEWVEVRKPKTRLKRTPLEIIASSTTSLGKDKIQVYRDVETKLISDMLAVQENDDRRNELESYIYLMRERVLSSSGACSAYMKQADKDIFSSALTGAEDWLYDHDEATTLELCDKLEELQSLGRPVTKRFQVKADARDYAEKIEASMREVRMKCNSSSEDFAHIDADKKAQVVAAADELCQWVQAELGAESTRELYEDAVLKVDDMKTKKSAIISECAKVMSEPKPAPPPAPPAPEAEAPAAEPAKEGEHAAAEGSPEEGAQAQDGDGDAEMADAAKEEAPADEPMPEATEKAAAAEPAGEAEPVQVD